MADFKLTTPLVFMVFNRPTKTRLVFEAIAKAKPTKLFIIADGPTNKGDEVQCREVKQIIEKGINWPCQVFTNYAEKNMGCKNRISSGLNWVFQNIEEAIILEDDCLPDQTFFRFCQELLEKYRHEPKITQIGGYNFAVLDPKFKCSGSYYFSNIGSIWGWATWRRAWQHYDVDISNWPEVKNNNFLEKVLGDKLIADHYQSVFDRYYQKTVNSWDGQWFFARWMQQGLSIVPKDNLVSNIGFDEESAHSLKDPHDARATLTKKSMVFPLQHPTEIAINKKADEYTFREFVGINKSLRQKAKLFFKSHFPGLYQKLKTLQQ